MDTTHNRCDRCLKLIPSPWGVPTMYCVLPNWPLAKFAQPGERWVCIACMREDPLFMKAYPSPSLPLPALAFVRTEDEDAEEQDSDQGE